MRNNRYRNHQGKVFCMRDTEMDLYPDYMCIPTIAADGWRRDDETYVQSLREFIKFQLERSDLAEDINALLIY